MFIETIWYLKHILKAFQVSRFHLFWYTKPHDLIKSLNCRINGYLKAIYFVRKDTKRVLYLRIQTHCSCCTNKYIYRSPDGLPRNPAFPSFATLNLVPLSTPAGIVIFIFFATLLSPNPLQFSHLYSLI